MRRKGQILIAALAMAFPAAASVLVPPGPLGPVPGDGDVAPFGAGDLGGFFITGWQQIYDSTLFGSGPMTIAGIRFFRTQFTDPSYDTINSSDYTITLITTTLPIDALDPTSLAANAVSGTVNSATFFSGPLSGHVGSSFTISAANPAGYYNYDPSEGNLLVYITKTGNSEGPSLFLDYAEDPSLPVSVAVEFSQTPDPNDPAANLSVNVTNFRGLVTEFLTPADTAVPEPGTFVPLGLATLALLGTRLRRGKELS